MSHGVYAKIARSISKDQLRLPVLPDVTQRIHQAVKNPDVSINDIAQIVQADPGLAAMLLKSVNSAGFRVFRKAKTVQDACARLGLQATRYQSTIYTVRNLFSQSTPLTRELLRSQAEKSATLAACASVLAAGCKGLDPDQAMLGAMLQDIGVLPLIGWIGNNPEKLEGSEPDKLIQVLSMAYAVQVGMLVLSEWKLEKAYADIVRGRLDWMHDGGRKLDYVDIINLARIHALGGLSARQKLPHITALPAYQKLPERELTERRTLQYLVDRQEQIDEIRQILLP